MPESPPISVPDDILNDCALERWTALLPERREAVAVALSQALTASGHAFTGWHIEAHGPDGEQPVLLFTDAVSRLDFALIPGGTLLPGYDDAQLQRYFEIYDAVEGRDDEGEWDAEETSDEYAIQAWERETPSLAQPTLFGSAAPCDLRRKPPVSIAPFLMATLPVHAGMPGVADIAPLPKWWGEPWEEMAEDYLHVPLEWQRVAPVLERYHWELPTTYEWEWATQGGKSELFFWGDEVPYFVVNPVSLYAAEYGPDALAYVAKRDAMIDREWPAAKRALVTRAIRFEDIMGRHTPPSLPHPWPYANRFGLVDLLVWGEWCTPSDIPGDPYPLISRGGASACYPWQSSQEWQLLLRAAERRHPHTDHHAWKVLRPVVRLR